MPGLKISNTRRSDWRRSMATPMAVNKVIAGTPRKAAHSVQWRVSSIRVSPTSKQTARMGMDGWSIPWCRAGSCCPEGRLAMADQLHGLRDGLPWRYSRAGKFGDFGHYGRQGCKEGRSCLFGRVGHQRDPALAADDLRL